MGAFLTFAQAKSKFSGLVSSGTTIDEAIQEVVNRAFEMARYPETTHELTIVTAHFTVSTDPAEVYIDIDPDTYDGAIGFRTESMGYPIMDQAALYHHETPSGDDSFIDLGIVTVSGSEKRRYRMPRGYTAIPTNTTFYALMKKRPPTLEEDDDVVPIRPWGALKTGVLAVSYENANDIERAEANWVKFDRAMRLDEKQFHGTKRSYIGFDGSTRVRPTNFM